MVVRAQERLEGADVRPYDVAPGSTVRKGVEVKLSAGRLVECTAPGDNGIGISLDAGNGDNTLRSTPSRTVRVALFGKGVCKVLVGTGGATEGSPAKWIADGCTDATVGGATTKLRVLGQFLESGALGDYVGLNLGAASWSVGA